MAEYDLNAFRESAIFQLNEKKGLISLSDPWDEFKQQSRAISDCFLTAATASLLVDLNSSMFFMNVCRATENWRRFLMAGQQHYNQRPSLSYHLPAYGPIISGQSALLTTLMASIPKTPVKGAEYPEQFNKIWLLLTLASNQCNESEEIGDWLTKLGESEKEPLLSPMIKALLGLEELTEGDFWESFDSALMNYEAWVTQRMDSTATSVSRFIASKFIWFEGLAILRLAQMKNFTMPSKNILFCPDEALVSPNFTYTGDWALVPV